MFDFVRKHNRIMQILLFLLIFPSFVLFGIDGYNRFVEKGEAVAVVDGHDITRAEWDAAHRNEVERLRASMPNVDVKLFDSPQAKYGSLDRLVRERLMQVAAERLHLGVSDQRLANELQQSPAIASLRRPDGTLDMERYRQLVGSQGMTPEMYENRVRADLSSRQVVNGVMGSSFAPAALSGVALEAYYQQREAQWTVFKPADFAARLKPTDEELRQHYQQHVARYQTPESVDIEYLMLDLATAQKGVVLNEADVRTYFEQNQARLQAKEERRASHILFAVDAKAPQAERDKVRAQAQQVLAELKKAPQRFAELARQHSKDPGSAAKGGDLDFFARGAMVKAFEEAAFSLNKGQISDLVETEFGYHILQITDIRQPKQASFESQRASLEAELRRQQAQRKFAELAEQFTNLVYEQSDSLQPAADRLKLEVHKMNGLTRQSALAAPLNNPKLLAAVFSADALEKKRNTEALEVGPSQLVAARVVHHVPAAALPYDKVQDNVRQSWLTQAALAAARQAGQEKLTQWKASADGAVLGKAEVLSRANPNQWPSALLEAVMHAPTSSMPAWVGADLGNQGYAVARINKVLAAPDLAARQQERAQFVQWVGTAEGLAYYNHLKERFKVVIKEPRPASAVQP
ncbi:MAG: peptidyl-prolyl cis-trans isomerase [Limnohabitans sp.]|nr:peptidyl-prolyl cis-trans isomerase [Limnohabitans sp.]